MKVRIALIVLLGGLAATRAATTINATNKYAWGANIGWLDCRGDVNNGAVIGEYVCSGYIYGANVGWIGLGDSTPANGVLYQNNSGTDYGVNHDGQGNLRGYAWGANIGWVNFENTGAAKVDLITGRLSGYAYSANCGWISLSNAVAQVRTDMITGGVDTDKDGIPDAYEWMWFGNLTKADSTSDYDHDGCADQQEALADTNPLDPNDNLRIVLFARDGSYNALQWTSQPTRFYRVERRAALDPAAPWEVYISLDWLGWNNVGFADFGSPSFYRIKAVRPASP